MQKPRPTTRPTIREFPLEAIEDVTPVAAEKVSVPKSIVSDENVLVPKSILSGENVSVCVGVESTKRGMVVGSAWKLFYFKDPVETMLIKTWPH